VKRKLLSCAQLQFIQEDDTASSCSEHLRMKRQIHIFALALAALSAAVSGFAQVLLDDTWTDGDRTDTNLPEESAWYANTVGIPGTPTLSASLGALTGNVRMFDTNTSSRLWITHFAPAGPPTELALGETFRLTLVFTVSNVTLSPATSRGLRIGLFNFSEPGAVRVSGDGFSTGSGADAPGANVTGYMLNVNFAQAFTINNPLQIMKRTDIASNNLMGASQVFASISSGGGLAGTPGFSNGVSYTFELSVKRNDASVDITTSFSDTNGWNISHTATDSGSPTFRFDGLAIRPNAVLDTADSFTFSRCKAELIPFQLRISSLNFVIPEGADIAWDALPGKTYEVYWRSSLDQGVSWTLLGSVIAAGTSASLRDFDAFFEAQRFYRVVQLP
jgi:hypothetical protein